MQHRNKLDRASGRPGLLRSAAGCITCLRRMPWYPCRIPCMLDDVDVGIHTSIYTYLATATTVRAKVTQVSFMKEKPHHAPHVLLGEERLVFAPIRYQLWFNSFGISIDFTYISINITYV